MSGHKITAPSSLNSAKSFLSTEFEQLGRNGECNAATLHGNPSNQLRRATKGYQPQAAEPVFPTEVKTLGLLEQCNNNSSALEWTDYCWYGMS